MPYAKPGYTRNQVDKAGETVSLQRMNEGGRISGEDLIAFIREYEAAMSIVNNWRASHSYPLRQFRAAVNNRLRQMFSQSLIVQRLKRLNSITAKLERFPNMGLSRMQDIGGCRVILPTVTQVDSLIEDLESRALANVDKPRKRDYIAEPKEDGYRSVHLTYRYQTSSSYGVAFNKLRLELQVRSEYQHAWATALETVATFTDQALKSDGGDPRWRRFFRLMGSIIALIEKRPKGDGLPTYRELIHEVQALEGELQVEKLLSAWKKAVEVAHSRGRGNTFLLQLNLDQRLLTIQAYPVRESTEAQEAYARVEQISRNDLRLAGVRVQEGDHWESVLVSASSVRELRKAYPNYFADTQAFIAILRTVLGIRDQLDVAGDNDGLLIHLPDDEIPTSTG